jgi:hypothetical protein
MEKKKMSSEELETVNGLRNQYAEISVKLGQIKIEQYHVNMQLERLYELEQSLFEEYRQLNDTEKQFLNSIQQKYGDGEINIETGEIFTVK